MGFTREVIGHLQAELVIVMISDHPTEPIQDPRQYKK
jgi:hypothetical protein